MEVYGYEKGSDKEEPIRLSEVSLLLTLEEIDSMIEFFKYVRDSHGKLSTVSGLYHSHLKDWSGNANLEPDIIVLSKFDNK